MQHPVIDLRSSREGCRVLLGSLHLPAKDWNDRSLELPPRNHKFSIFYSSDDLESTTCASMVKERFDADVDSVFDVNNESAFWEKVPSDLICIGGAPGSDVELKIATYEKRLWQPSSFIYVFLDSLNEWREKLMWSSTSNLRILDAGSGTGRNAVFIAQSLQSSHITAIDNRRSMIEKAEKFIRRNKVDNQITCKIADIDDFIRSSSDVEEDLFDVAIFMRFVHKKALSRIRRIMKPTGIIIVEAFHISSIHPSDEDQKIKEGEVQALLKNQSGQDVTLLIEKVLEIEDKRPVVCVVCSLNTC
jgi:SAM-dependent methyltransferase